MISLEGPEQRDFFVAIRRGVISGKNRQAVWANKCLGKWSGVNGGAIKQNGRADSGEAG